MPHCRSYKRPSARIAQFTTEGNENRKRHLMHTIDWQRRQIQYRIIVRTQFDKRSHQLDWIAHKSETPLPSITEGKKKQN